MYQFSGLIKCTNCGKKYKGRKERGHQVYICSTYSHGSEKCFRYVIHESDLVKIVEGHLKLKGVSIEESLSEHVLYIEVNAMNRGYEIYYDDDLKSIVSTDETLGIKYKL